MQNLIKQLNRIFCSSKGLFVNIFSKTSTVAGKFKDILVKILSVGAAIGVFIPISIVLALFGLFLLVIGGIGTLFNIGEDKDMTETILNTVAPAASTDP